MRIGVVSDTHGYLNPRVVDVLEGVDRILHAGDIGSQEVILGLETVAPVTAGRAPRRGIRRSRWSSSEAGSC